LKTKLQIAVLLPVVLGTYSDAGSAVVLAERAGRRWASGATLVYAPIAEQLVARSPVPLAGRTVLDVGAGTGVAGVALAARGARPIAIDLSVDMLAVDARSRPPAVVADVLALPLRHRSVDGAVAAFVLNHLTRPTAGLVELARVTRPGGPVLACVYANSSHSAARDRVDDVAREAGWVPPDWYTAIKTAAAPLLGTAATMAAAARTAGLVEVTTAEEAVDVGVTTPERLVEYRFGQAHFGHWLDGLDPVREQQIRRLAADAAGPVMTPYRPIVVFLTAQAST
jgi:ubiquinone/menaquinone biosynthesis C-methylase UbiE